MLAALAVGTTRPALEVVAAHAGAGPNEVSELLAAVHLALLPARAPRRVPHAVAVDGAGPTADHVRALLELALTDVTIGDDTSADGADVAVIVAHYVIEPSRHALWLRRDVPHLPVVFGDRGARVGPFVEPGDGPCLHCLDLQRTDRDAAWPAMATQLLGRRAASETALTSFQAAALATRLAIARLDGDHAHAATSMCIDAASGELSESSHLQHDRCGCRSLPENGTPPARLRAVRPAPPSSAAIAPSRA
jgi:bacteriocin biosynthesis cyclodehydratase domain-containing protein